MPIIKKPNQHFDATLYTGNGGTQSITNAGGFQPNLVWIKNRGSAQDNILLDSIRGTTNFLISNWDGAEATAGDLSISYNSNGFSVIGVNARSNASSNTYVGWQWKAGGASTVNTSGSISSNVSVNTTAGFSVVTYTNSAGRNAHTVGHGLGVAPKMFIIKTRSATADWPVYHTSLGATKAVYLNLTLNEQTNATFFNNTAPSSSVITLGSGLSDAGVTIVAYCFAEVEGYSKFGSYTGNGSTDGPFIYTGFRPRFILARDTSVSGQEWTIYDTARSPYNQVGNKLSPDLAAVESVWAGPYDILSNGFKLRTTDARENRNNSTFIYAAFAEAPFKYANAR